MLDMYGYAVDALHHTPNDVERSVQTVPGNPASAQSVVEYEHVFGVPDNVPDNGATALIILYVPA